MKRVTLPVQGDFSDVHFGDVVELAGPGKARIVGVVVNERAANEADLSFAIVAALDSVMLITNRAALTVVGAVDSLDRLRLQIASFAANSTWGHK